MVTFKVNKRLATDYESGTSQPTTQQGDSAVLTKVMEEFDITLIQEPWVHREKLMGLRESEGS